MVLTEYDDDISGGAETYSLRITADESLSPG